MKEIVLSRKERKSLSIALIIISFIQLWYFLLPEKGIDQSRINAITFEDSIPKAKFQDTALKKPDIAQSFNEIHSVKKSADLYTEPVMVNQMDSIAWVSLGFKSFVAANIIKYRSKAGDFRTKDQLKKIYYIDTFLLNQLNLDFSPGSSNHKSNVKRYEILDINTADSIQLEALKAIGPVLSQRILRFRESLGGFHDSLQLLEVYGIPPDIYGINPGLRCKPKVNPILINTCNFNDLKRHPYISYKISRHIINYRDMHGPYKSVEDIKLIKTISDSVFHKIKPYLSLKG